MVLYICHPLDKVGGMDDKVGESGKRWSILTKRPRRPDMLFRGQSYRSLDAKGRLMLPPEFRDALTASSTDGLRNSSRKIRDFRRLVLGGAEDQSFDAQGRIRLSRAHVEYAGLEHDAVVVGQGDKFEIWDQARFKALLSQDFDDVADELAESGIDFSF